MPGVDAAEDVELGLFSGAVDPLDLQSRMKLSDKALSKESPTEPIEAAMSASTRRWMNWIVGIERTSGGVLRLRSRFSHTRATTVVNHPPRCSTS
jgi:hypothetical protein